MRQITLAQALLWLVNAALVARLFFLVFVDSRSVPMLPAPDRNVYPPGGPPACFDRSFLRNLPNPLPPHPG